MVAEDRGFRLDRERADEVLKEAEALKLSGNKLYKDGEWQKACAMWMGSLNKLLEAGENCLLGEGAISYVLVDLIDHFL